ncbi:MAG: O-methyltransferase [Saprospiraceae bacterium]|nr:O-methyltransferase [Saprospiraceae bacterium]
MSRNIISSPDIVTYCKQFSTPVDSALAELAERTKNTVGQEVMLSEAYLGRFLQIIGLIVQPKYILEVGTFTGYGAICLAQIVKADGKVITLEKDQRLKDFASDIIQDLKLTDKIEAHFGDAAALIEALDYEFDLVFIDAAKRQYIDYYERVLPKLRSGGIIIADNVLWKGLITNENKDKLCEGLDMFNRHVHEDARTENILLPIDDGINLIRKK